jgi:hypothetical protein
VILSLKVGSKFGKGRLPVPVRIDMKLPGAVPILFGVGCSVACMTSTHFILIMPVQIYPI